MWQLRSCPEPEGECWSQVTHGGPEAVPSREAGAGAVGTRSGPGAALSQEVRAGALGHVGPPCLLS
jgi:hypothetical protein